MCEPLRRVDLPSGGWWEIVTRPRWKHLRQWVEADGDDLVDRALLSLTTAWSFGQDISLASLRQREPRDLVAILKTFREEVIPWLEESDLKDMAEELFAGMVEGRVPRRFLEVHLMAATGWSWQTLRTTPADVVQRMAVYLAVKQAQDNKTSLELREAEEVDDGQ